MDRNTDGYCHIPAGAYDQTKGPVNIETDESLRRRLTDFQYRVTRENATEYMWTSFPVSRFLFRLTSLRQAVAGKVFQSP